MLLATRGPRKKREFGGIDGGLLHLVSSAFSSILTGDRWYLERAALGIVGTIRTLEITHGQNGWHPHLHVLVLTSSPLDNTARAQLTDYMWSRWSGFLDRRGHHGTTRERGIITVPVRSPGDVARYMSKVYDTVHLEMTRSDLKRGGGRNPFKILAELVEAGSHDPMTGEVNRDLLLWREYERATWGVQFITWSAGLKQRFGINEVTDDELVNAEAGGELVGTVPLWAWSSIRVDPQRMAHLLDAAERHGEAGVYEYLDSVPSPRVPAPATG
jgi:hypothetical protein